MSAHAPLVAPRGNRAYHRGRLIRAVATYAILTAVVIASLYPAVIMVINSFKSNNEININPGGFPVHWTVEDYVNLATTNGNQLINFANSVFVATVTTVLSLVVVALAAFAFAKLRFWGREVIFFLLLATIMVPGEIGLPPLYLMFSQVGWTNTYQVQIIPFIPSVFGLFLMRQYMRSVPGALLDAARIDGANDWQIFWRIMIPVSAPVLGVFAILQFLGMWNSYLWPSVMANTADVAPLSLTLPSLRDPVVGFLPVYGTIMAGSVLATLPIVIVFLLNQDKFMSGVVVGSVKE